jgi:hypothetical protein
VSPDETSRQFTYHALVDPEKTSVQIVRDLHRSFGLPWADAISTLKTVLAEIEEEIRC